LLGGVPYGSPPLIERSVDMGDFVYQMKTFVLDQFGITIAITAIIVAETALYIYRRFFKES
jgi:hypothetical protein